MTRDQQEFTRLQNAFERRLRIFFAVLAAFVVLLILADRYYPSMPQDERTATP
jgi:hypothetical protein